MHANQGSRVETICATPQWRRALRKPSLPAAWPTSCARPGRWAMRRRSPLPGESIAAHLGCGAMAPCPKHFIKRWLRRARRSRSWISTAFRPGVRTNITAIQISASFPGARPPLDPKLPLQAELPSHRVALARRGPNRAPGNVDGRPGGIPESKAGAFRVSRERPHSI